MVIGNDELEAVEAAGLEALEEERPWDFGFAEGDDESEDLAFSIRGRRRGR